MGSEAFFRILLKLNKNLLSDFTNPVLYCIIEVYVTFYTRNKKELVYELLERRISLQYF